MSAEPRRITKTEVWTQWESQIINGVFPLRRFLGGSDHSAVFLTEYKPGNLADAAIKFVPADTLQTEAQLVQWGAAATLSHPHLLRVFDVGRCQFGGRGFLFVVMEHAEQTLAQVLRQRALSPDEVREMLPATLDALAFLHGKHLVHGQLKPSNILVVNDQLKLASDTVRPIGNSTSGIVRTSSYDPPELRDGVVSTAGDIWGLGVTLVEALTQRTPAWPDERYEAASLPAGFPAPFVDTVRRCLSLTPANRPSVIELQTQYKPAPEAQVMPVPQPPAREAPRAAPAPQNFTKRRPLLPAIAAALLILLVVWVGLRFSQKHPDTRPSTSGTSQTHLQPPAATAVPGPAAPSAIAKAAESDSQLSSPVSRRLDQPSPPTVAPSPSVLHEVTPDVPKHIRDGIHGHIRVTVRVLVDPSGNVVGELLEIPGPSRYFARVAGDAAAEWKFTPADVRDSRVWRLRFDFDRGGVTVDATAVQ